MPRPTAGRPIAPDFLDLEKPRYLGLGSAISEAMLGATLSYKIRYLQGIDGGRIDEPAEAMDYLDNNLDGGQM